MSKTNEVLSSLTADRLEALAAACDDDSMPLALGDAAQVAGVLRALAGAERAILADPAAQICLYDEDGSGAIGIEKNVGVRQSWSTAVPTLISALASVAKQEEANDG